MHGKDVQTNDASGVTIDEGSCAIEIEILWQTPRLWQLSRSTVVTILIFSPEIDLIKCLLYMQARCLASKQERKSGTLQMDFRI